MELPNTGLALQCRRRKLGRDHTLLLRVHEGQEDSRCVVGENKGLKRTT